METGQGHFETTASIIDLRPDMFEAELHDERLLIRQSQEMRNGPQRAWVLRLHATGMDKQ